GVGRRCSGILLEGEAFRAAAPRRLLECVATASLRSLHVAEPMPLSSRTRAPICFPSEATVGAGTRGPLQQHDASASAEPVPNHEATRPGSAPGRALPSWRMR